MSTKNTAGHFRTVTFRFTTRQPLPVGEQVFVTGNVAELGHWEQPGFALTRMDDLLWEGHVSVESTLTIEYKITRGSWETEEVLPGGQWPRNSTIAPGPDRVEERVLFAWRDQRVVPPEIVGDYRVHENVTSAHLELPRTVIVWLPPSYATQPDRRYPVLYLHDGQQVFDPTTSTHQQDWQVDECCTELINADRMEEIIAVGIYSTTKRREEYAASHTGAAYARFVVEELKPFIDSTYRTRPEREHTAVAGSSMGGGIAFYTAWTYADVFSAAACLSPAFTYRQDDRILKAVQSAAAVPDTRFFLYGGHGDDLERLLIQDLYAMRDALASKGVKPGPQLLIVEDPEGLHNEAAWAKHTSKWLLFFYGTSAS